MKPVSSRIIPLGLAVVAAGAMAAILTGSGCRSDPKSAATTQPTDVRQSQEQALQDPFGYKPNFDTDISGGGLTDFNSKSIKKDLDSVFNP